MKKRLSSCLGSLAFLIIILILLVNYGGALATGLLDFGGDLVKSGVDAVIRFAKKRPFVFLIILLLIYFGAKKEKK